MRAPDVTQPIAAGSAPLTWQTPMPHNIIACPLPYLGLGDRMLLRGLALLASRHVVAMHGLQHIRPAMDPFILAANHSSRAESLLVPALLFLHRGGRLLHFLADWNFRLIPGVGLIYARAQVVTVTRKPARPRFLNALKPLYESSQPTLERARAHLAAGRAVGIFPEGQVNRSPDRLLRGRRGAARLSLETGIPVVPMGIRFPHADPGRPLPALPTMELHIGAPLLPPGPAVEPASTAAVTAWHAVVMTEIARLSGKAWTAPKEATP
ncbi:MAG: lysophospholipid acyltransferase family protein [Hyphomicrobiaceae bacterium]